MTTVTFSQQSTYNVGSAPYLHGAGPYSLSVADLNGDGILDLIAGNYGDNVLVNTTNTAEIITNTNFSAANIDIVLVGVHLALSGNDFHL